MYKVEEVQLIDNRRKEWIPVNPSAQEVLPEEISDFMSRVLSLRYLELKVADFLKDGLDRKEGKALAIFKEALERNMLDEERHDEALNNCVRAYANYNVKQENVLLNQILPAWLELSEFPILTALTLENGLFFLILPWLRRLGTSAMVTTSSDISADETLHVYLHRMVCKQLNLRPTKRLNNLRKATIEWLVGDYKDEHIDLDKALSISDKLYYRGVSDALEYQQTFQMPAFFEIPSDSLPYYV